MALTFLSAEWRNLLLVNYETPANLLARYLPHGVELDLYQGRALVSLVGFRFLRTRLLGRIPVPFHINFDELNLRFYVVRRTPDGEVRRGVVFVREYVPRFAIALTARALYQEPYVAVPMRHTVPAPEAGKVSYGVKVKGRWHTLSGNPFGAAVLSTTDPEISFITEHYWGYTRRGPRTTSEYQVVHEPWQVQHAAHARFEGDVAAVYGPEWTPVLSQPPVSAFFADGSSVRVRSGSPVR